LSLEKIKKENDASWWNRPHYLHIFLFTYLHSLIKIKAKVPCDYVIAKLRDLIGSLSPACF